MVDRHDPARVSQTSSSVTKQIPHGARGTAAAPPTAILIGARPEQPWMSSLSPITVAVKLAVK